VKEGIISLHSLLAARHYEREPLSTPECRQTVVQQEFTAVWLSFTPHLLELRDLSSAIGDRTLGAWDGGSRKFTLEREGNSIILPLTY